MINSKVVISVGIVLMIGIVAAGYQITTSTPGLWQSTDIQVNPSDGTGGTGTSDGQGQGGTGGTGTSDGQGQGGTGGNKMKISPEEAKSIAQKNIQEPGAVAGTPKIETIDNKQVYVVPVLKDGKEVGGFFIDPQTGKIIEGWGGAP